MKKILINSMLSLGVMLSSSSFALNASESVTIQAESYTRAANGVQKENTSDVGGGQNVGYLDAGRWLTYDTTAALSLPCDGSYKIEYRVASPNNSGKINFVKDGGTPVYGSINIPNTGGYQTWQTISHNLDLPKGTLPYSLVSVVGGWNINWFRITAPSCVNPNVARWLIDTSKSSFDFVSVKKSATGTEAGESFTFKNDAGLLTIAGSISHDGKAELTIPLNDIFTGVGIRNDRMKALLFETVYLPKAHFQTQLDLNAIESMAVGEIKTLAVNGSLTLHGIVKSLAFDLTVVKHSNSAISLSPRKPILINAADFELNYGIQVLKGLANLASIGQASPVYFNLQLTKDNPNNTFILAIPARPQAPTNLMGVVSQATAKVDLTWTDMSQAKAAYLIRRKGADGFWTTLGTTSVGEVIYSPAATNLGAYDYKVIAFSDSTPSEPSNIERLEFTTDLTPEARGEMVFKGSGLCQGCHKDDNGDGFFKDGIAHINVNTFAAIQAKGYRTDSVEGIADFILREMGPRAGAITLAESTDIARWLWSLRGQDEIINGLACNSTDPVKYAPRSIKLLTSYEYANSLQALFPGRTLPQNYAYVLAPNDETASNIPAQTATAVTGGRLANFRMFAEEMADWAISNNALPFSCSNRDALCQTNFVTQFANKAMRRPLSAEEAASYKSIIAASPTGLKVAIQTLLASPQFLYRTEIGIDVATASNFAWGKGELIAKAKSANNGAFVLEPYELASALSYMYTGSSPDSILMQAAESGDLYADSTLSAQIDRLLDSPKGREHTARFAGLYAGTDKVTNAVREDLTGNNAFTPAVRDAMSEEIRQMYSHVFYGNKPLSDLFAGDFTVLNKTLSDFYAIPSNSTSATDWQWVDTSMSKRGGILASGAYMATYAHTTHTSPIKRAVHVRQDFLCQNIPLPTSFEDPLGLRDKRMKEINDLLKTTGLTTTEYYHLLTTTPNSVCLDCHKAMINPLFAMDDFDNVGRLRSLDAAGQVIQNVLTDTVGEKGASAPIAIVNQGGRIFEPNATGAVNFTAINALPESAATPFKGSKELSKLFVKDEAVGVKSCFINKAYRYTTGLPLNKAAIASADSKLKLDAKHMSCIEKSLHQNFSNSTTPRVLMRAIGMEPGLRIRR
jgi:polyisoprenoid-binding protein YceI